ncbi:nitroalkane oxidase [Aspergillus udagawae]|nr:nitroalkane oxidase [Aspergillus udagawae]
MVDFNLSNSEQQTRAAARSFAAAHLAGAQAIYSDLATPEERFQSLRPIYAAAVKANLIKAQVPAQIGGSSTNLVEAAILVEEFYAVEASASLTIFGTGLGLTPVALAYRPPIQKFLDPFLASEGAPLASLVFSEPAGVANWLEPGAPGLQTTARREGDEWVLNGEKIWATNSAGWDFRGADLSCVVCRCVDEDVVAQASCPQDLIMILLVTRENIHRNGPDSFQVIKHVETAGHTATSGPHIKVGCGFLSSRLRMTLKRKYTNLRIPVENVLCAPGAGAPIVLHSFEISAMLVGAMGVGVQRAVFDAALAFSHDSRGGTIPIAQRQSVADLLINIKMRTETSRYLTWKAAHCLTSGPGEHTQRREHALLAKVHCSDAAVQSCLDAINAVGVSAYNLETPFASLLATALVLPIFDGGNVGIRRRALQDLFLEEGYQPWGTTFGFDNYLEARYVHAVPWLESLAQILGRCLIGPGVFDGISTRVASQIGFDFLYLAGSWATGSYCSEPDLSVMTQTEFFELGRMVALHTETPVIADADTGFGGPLDISRTVRLYEHAGIAGLLIEDQVFPKRCGQLQGKDVVDLEVFIERVRSAVEERQDSDFVIIARTDARQAKKFGGPNA